MRCDRFNFISKSYSLNVFGTVLGDILDSSKLAKFIFYFIPRNCNKVSLLFPKLMNLYSIY